MALLVSVDGNIGSGKSTWLEELKKEITNRNIKDFIFLQEPVDIWSTITFDGKTILEKFYEDPVKYAFSFQMMAYISRLSIIEKAVKENPKSIIISERSLLTDKQIFAKMLYDDNKIDSYSYQIYNMWFDHFYNKLPKHKHIYLYSTPNIILNRINSRNRKGEELINKDYLINCHKYHEDMFDKNKDLIKVIDMDNNILSSENYKDEINNTINFLLLTKNKIKLESEKKLEILLYYNILISTLMGFLGLLYFLSIKN
jgi:deoxyadenosine/deoxycytidine kinase